MRRKYTSVDLVDFLEGRMNNNLFLDKLNNLFFKETNNQNSSIGSILFSLHWFKKGYESDIAEDKLLNYWIAIENIFNVKEGSSQVKKNDNFNKILFINEYASAIILLKEISNKPGYFFRYCWHQAQKQKFWGDENTNPQIKLSKETMECCQLNKNIGDTIDIRNFIDNLKILRTETQSKFISDEILEIENFYGDNKFALNELEERNKQIQDEIKKIYRYRNFIVHNAHFDNKILPIYTKKAELFTIILINSLLNEMIRTGSSNHFDIIFSKKVELDQMMAHLKMNDQIDLLLCEKRSL